MAKRIVQAAVAVIVVLVLWQALDFVMHQVILAPTYEATAHLWRRMEEMKLGLMVVVSIVSAACFVGIYTFLVRPKSAARGLAYGLIYGVAGGIGMGLGSYTYMDIPSRLALVWLLGTLVQMILAGLLVGLIVRPVKRPEPQ